MIHLRLLFGIACLLSCEAILGLGHAQSVLEERNPNDMTPSERAVEELTEIDKASYDLAKSALINPDRKDSVRPTAEALHKRLLSIAKYLKNENPEIYETHSHIISESLLDLKYVMSPSVKGISLRLAHIVRQRQEAD